MGQQHVKNNNGENSCDSFDHVAEVERSRVELMTTRVNFDAV